MGSSKRHHEWQTDPVTGQQFIIKANGQRMSRPQPAEVWRPKWLAAFRESGNIRAACEAAGIDRKTFSNARANSPEFAAQIEEAREDAVDILEAVAFVRATTGKSDMVLMRLLEAHRPEVYGRRRSGYDPTDDPSSVQVHIYLPDNARPDQGAPALGVESPERIIEVGPQAIDEERLPIPPDTDAEKLAWLQAQPWYGTRRPK